MKEAIVVQSLSKQFRRFHPERPMTLIEAIVKGWGRLRPTEYFWALQNVGFTLEKGQMLGVIGHNGAGKSTLLRLVGGVGKPDKGQVKTNGRIGALLDLGTGFHPEMTGRENVYVSGVISGLTRREVAQRFDSIVAFAELEPFIDTPLRTYSTGMQMRLAFAVASHIEPEILLIDEVLAVGDMAFQRKCLDRIARFKESGCAILLVSHDVGQVQKLCDQVLWLRRGQVTAYGPPEVVTGQYVAEMTAETKRRAPVPSPTGDSKLRINENRFGSLEMEITAVHLLDSTGKETAEIQSGQPLQIYMKYNAPQPIPNPVFVVTITREDGFVCYDTSTAATQQTIPTLQGAGQIVLNFERLDLMTGRYYIEVGVYEQNWVYAYDYHWHIYPLQVKGNSSEKGILRPPHQWTLP